MTKKKTSIEKLETRNEKVKDLSSALVASLWKWRKVKYEAIKLWSLIDHTCGFCMYATQRRTTEKKIKCELCPTEVREFCNELQGETSEIMDKMDHQIELAFEFLAGLKYDA